MTTMQTVSVAVLWIGFLLLAGLVLLLYRQVERAYNSDAKETAALLPGVRAPDVEILDGEEIGPLAFPPEPAMSLLAFVSTTCEACVSLIDALAGLDGFDGRKTILVNGEGDGGWQRRPGLDILWLAHPPDVVRTYGVSAVPMVYVLRGRTIIGGGVLSTRRELGELLDEARERAPTLPPAHQPGEETLVPVTSSS